MRLKIDLYRRLARVTTEAELDDFARELTDRFGSPPTEAQRLLTLSQVRIAAHRWQVRSIRMENRYVVLGYASGRLIRQLAAQSGGQLRVVDDESAYLPLGQDVTDQDRILAIVKSLLQRG